MDNQKADELIRALNSLEDELSDYDGLRSDINELTSEINELNQQFSGTSGGLFTSGREGLGEKLDKLQDSIEDLRRDVQNID